MLMLKASRLKDLLVVIILVTLVAGISHFVITNPLGPSRLLYYPQAQVIQWNTRCSPEAPDWMVKTQRYATRNMAAPASQLAYVSPDGRLHHCETGWKDGILGDQPLQSDTRFRFPAPPKRSRQRPSLTWSMRASCRWTSPLSGCWRSKAN